MRSADGRHARPLRRRPRSRAQLSVRTAFRLLALVGAGWLAGVPGPALGQDPLSTEPHVSLLTILPKEISDSGTVVLPPLRTFADRTLEVRAASSVATRGSRDSFRTLVEREIPELWEVRMPVSVPPHQLDVSYQLHSSRGREGHLSHRERDSSDLRVRLRPIPPRIIERGEDSAVIQGGVILVFDVTTADLAGTYLGTLTTTVTQL